MVMIRGKDVRFKAEQINGVYTLDNVDMSGYEAMDCSLKISLAEHLYPGREVP